jgi:hypothetical protein
MKAGFFVLFNAEEIRLLRQADSREAALYFHLKTLAEFKSGWVGAFRSQRLSVASLADALSRPPRQGKTAEAFSDDQLRGLLGGLVRLELAAVYRRSSDSSIRIFLLASPEDSCHDPNARGADEVMQYVGKKWKFVPVPAGDVPAMSPQGAVDVSRCKPAARAAPRVARPDVPDPSRKCTENPNRSNSSIRPVGAACQRTNESASTGTAVTTETTEKTNKHGARWAPSENSLEKKPETPRSKAPSIEASATTRLTVGEVVEYLKAAGRFKWLDSKLSRSHMQRWVDTGISAAALLMAIEGIPPAYDRLKVEAVTDELTRQNGKKQNGRRQKDGLVL